MCVIPTYKFYNHSTKHTWTEFMGISECDKFLADNPHVERLVNGAPMLVSGVGGPKVADGFRDVLKNIKRNKPGATFEIP